jgi:hypothetical protein
LYDELVGLVNSSDIVFAKYAKQAISTFSQLDPSFQSNFESYLIDNICPVTQPFFVNQAQVTRCYTGMHFGVM